MKTVLYTCTFLDYDQIFSPVRPTPGLDFVLFSDRRPRFLRGWQWRPLPREAAGLSQTLANRYAKFFAHRLFPEAGISIYIDGNTLVRGDLSPLIADFAASGAAIGLFEHKQRGNIVDEFDYAVRVGKIRPEEAVRGRAQIETYLAAGLPRAHPFTENGIIFRRHGAPGLDAAMALWWNEINAHTQRDQLSLPYVLHAAPIATKIWDWNYKFDNPYFERYPHRTNIYEDVHIYLKMRRHYGAIYKLALDPARLLLNKLIKPLVARR